MTPSRVILAFDIHCYSPFSQAARITNPYRIVHIMPNILLDIGSDIGYNIGRDRRHDVMHDIIPHVEPNMVLYSSQLP